ncbi:aminotransferase class I/II-fold pyridoxal phosphate-dependent enzyme [Leucobacter luti]|uniref:Succinyldiaminopimelate aminotransferase n=1 Tax=Leucobacter luti TaxID=340320 RepID=A0A4Q7U1N3_9MICO|nr:aminotransferase class I/II-fold pyridoxal phosphate-dependent enzyme [Leucobacter luti]MBL3699139.1 aminotransferase class I/II-fold pyridoxal phosphate-dependent enzyme [Leucobacter luti]RZT66640.1 succinyldiaminopimelate aminotransferase [Leucobacter luti]
MTPRWRTVAQASGLAAPDGTTRPTIFAEMTALAHATGAANLGQGFPDADGPAWIREAAVDAIRGGANQYPPGRGIPELRAAIAAHQLRHYGIELDPDREVLVTAGATEALAAAVTALAGPGDEVVTLEPFYDAHAAVIALAGATHVTVPLRPSSGGFRVDTVALAARVNERTRLILVNSPHNPTGTVLSDAELDAIAAAARRVGAIVITDEVYEHLVFGARPHRPIATLPGMAERTVTISSAGKTFSLTGWKIGWATGPAELIEALTAVKQFLTYSGGAPFQPAIARALTEGDPDIAELRNSLAARRDLLIAGLRAAGFSLVEPDGTYFVCADASPFFTAEVRDGAEFARALPALAGVACIPLSAFCHPGSDTAGALASWVRFTFVKDEATLLAAIERLAQLTPRPTH